MTSLAKLAALSTFTWALAIASCLTGAAIAQPAGQKLTGAEIKATFFGHTFEVANSDGAKFNVTINADGSGGREGVNQRGQSVKHVGRFKIENDQLCRFYENVNNNKVICFEIYRQGPKFLQIFEGNLNAIITVLR